MSTSVRPESPITAFVGQLEAVEAAGHALFAFPPGRHQQRVHRTPALTLIVAINGDGPLFDGLLESLAGQSYVGFEVIFIDAGGAPAAFASACQFAGILDRAVVYRATNVDDRGKSWTLGRDLARGEMLGLLEIGCIVDAAFTSRMVATLSGDSAIAVVQCAHAVVHAGGVTEPHAYRASTCTVRGPIARVRAQADPRFAAVPSAMVIRRVCLPGTIASFDRDRDRTAFRSLALQALLHGDLAYLHEPLVAVLDPRIVIADLAATEPPEARPSLPDACAHSAEALAAAEVHVAAGRMAEAETLLEGALARDPFSAEALNDLGVLSFRRGDAVAARKLFQSALEIDQDHAQARDNLEALPPPAPPSPPPIEFVGMPGPRQVDPTRYTTPATCQIPNLADIYTRHLGFRRDGVFVEVGAFDGEYVSNTSNLADLGWRGHYIEPVPEQAAACRRRHARNPATRVFELAISDSDGEADIFVGGPLSTMSPDALKLFQSFAWAKGFHSGRAVRVTQITLDRFLVDNGIPPGFDVLSIDVEGFELNVMRGFDLARWAPRLVIVELHDENEAYAAVQDDCRAVARRLSEQGYRVVFKDKTNTVYTR